MKSELESIQHELETMKAQMHRATRRARLVGGLGFLALVGAIAVIGRQPVGAQGGYGPTLTSLQNQVNALISKTQFQSADAATKTTKFVGCNVYVQNGLGATNGRPSNPYDTSNSVVNGVGNLIVGYNELRQFGFPNTRTGSHNLILGIVNDYSSYGGLVAGEYNTLSSPCSSISGGDENTTSGEAASVSGGSNNIASGFAASVTGGGVNVASGPYASIAGGQYNSASGYWASVTGGDRNTASYDKASVSGGRNNIASGDTSSVNGGKGNAATGTLSAVLGGYGNNASGKYSIVCGGYLCGAAGNNPSGDFTANLGGYGTSVSAQYGHNP